MKNATYEETVEITVKVTGNKTANEGNLSITIQGTNFSANVTNGTATIKVNGLNASDYKTNISYSGGKNYNPTTKEVEFTVEKHTPTIQIIKVKNATYEGIVEITVKVTGNKTVNEGNVTITIQDKTFNATIKNGTATIQISGLDVNNYNADIIYSGEKNYNPTTKEVSFKVTNETARIDLGAVINCTYGGNITIQVIIQGSKTPVRNGTIYLEVGNQTYEKNLTSSSARFVIPNLDAGDYIGVLSYDGGLNYASEPINVPFTVKQAVVDMNASAENITYGNTATININVSSYGKAMNIGKITTIINNQTYSANVTNGTAKIEIPNLDAGSYKIELQFNAGENYTSKPINVTFTVKQIIVDLDISIKDIIYGDALAINVKANAYGKAINEGIITALINNKQYRTNVINGLATIMVYDLDSGSYNAIISFDNGKNYNNPAKEVPFNVLKQDTYISASNKAYVINYAGTYSIALKDQKGNPLPNQKVTFTLKGKTIASAITDAQGIAKIKLSAKTLKTAKAGKKNMLISFNGDSNHNLASKTVKITINKEKTKIVAKKKTFKKSKKIKRYVVFLKNSKKKAIKKVKITLRIKGKTYKAKTNKIGKAIFKIKKLNKKGKYNATIKFKGNKYYKATNKKVKIIIK